MVVTFISFAFSTSAVVFALWPHWEGPMASPHSAETSMGGLTGVPGYRVTVKLPTICQLGPGVPRPLLPPMSNTSRLESRPIWVTRLGEV